MSAIEPYRGAPERPAVFDVPSFAEAPSRNENLDLAGLVAAFRRHLGLFFLALAATLALVMVFLALYPVQYTATARVTVESRTLSPGPDKETPVISQLSTKDSADIDTEAQVMRSIRVVSRVCDMLHLDQDPEFSGHGGGGSLKGNLTQALLKLFAPPSSTSKRDDLINAVLAKLQPVRYLTTNAIDINYTDHNAAKAVRMANAFAQAYLDDQVAQKVEQNRVVAQGLFSNLEDMRRQADEDSTKVEQYKIAHNLLSVGQQTLTEQEISGYNQSIAAAKAELAGDEADLKTAQAQLANGSNGEDVGEALNSSVVGALRQQRAVLSAKLAEMQGHYGAKYPDMAQAKQQVADLDQEIRAEIQRTISNLAAKVAVSRDRLNTMQATLATTKEALAGNNAAVPELGNLERAASVSQAIYEAYLDRSKESVAQIGSLLPDATIVSRATLPDFPTFPNRILFIALGLVGGVLFGCAAILIAEMTENRMLTARDVEGGLGCAYLGGLPLLGSVSKGAHLSPLDAVVKEPRSAYSEAFRALRAATGFSITGSSPRAILITSALPQEGKTTLALGLARTSALQGVATVVVDCDIRQKGLSRALKLDDNRPGLTDVLKGEAALADALVIDPASGAYVLPVGVGAKGGDDLFDGEAMDELLNVLRSQFRAIVLDCSPVLTIAYARVLAAKSDGVIFATRWRATDQPTVRSALRLLPPDQVRLIGVVLTRVDVRQLSKYERGGAGRLFSKFKKYYA